MAFVAIAIAFSLSCCLSCYEPFFLKAFALCVDWLMNYNSSQIVKFRGHRKNNLTHKQYFMLERYANEKMFYID